VFPVVIHKGGIKASILMEGICPLFGPLLMTSPTNINTNNLVIFTTHLLDLLPISWCADFGVNWG